MNRVQRYIHKEVKREMEFIKIFSIEGVSCREVKRECRKCFKRRKK